MINYKLKTWKNKDQDYLDWISKQPSIIPCSRLLEVIGHHVECSGGKHGNDYLAVPVPTLFHIAMFHDQPEHETYKYYRIDIIKIICNLLKKYCYEKYNKVLPSGNNQDHISYLIEQIRFLKNKGGL